MRSPSLALLALAGVVCARPVHATNFLIIVLDDLGADKVGSYVADMYGSEVPAYVPDVPVIDSLASSGLRFADAWANPVCSPTRASLLTGLVPHEHKIGAIISTTAPELPTETVTLPELLAAQGYESGLFGKWHLGTTTPGGTDWDVPGTYAEPPAPTLHGFDAFYGNLHGQVYDFYDWTDTRYPVTLGDGSTGAQVVDRTDWASDAQVPDAVGWIASRSGPWMAVVSINAPHLDEEGAANVWEPDDLAPEAGGLCDDLDGDGECSNTENYATLANQGDARLGLILDGLRATDPLLLEDLVILLVGDNGTPSVLLEAPHEPAGERSDAGKSTVYEAGVRIPFLITRGCDWLDQSDGALDGLYDGASPACLGTDVPMATPGLTVRAGVQVHDVFATVGALAGVGAAPPDAAIDLTACLGATAEDADDCGDPVLAGRALYTERFIRPYTSGSDYGLTGVATSGHVAVKRGGMKLTGKIRSESAGLCMDYELYDLRLDPWETDDLLAGGNALTADQELAFLDLWDELRVVQAPDWLPSRVCDLGMPWDADADGFEDAAWGGTDCDDDDPSANPDADEVYYDGVDQNCDPDDDDDQDGDGYDATSVGGTDCDDTTNQVNPGRSETWYDGIDQNCDGRSDYDRDGDGYTATAYGGTDCVDTSAAIKPGARETWYDGVDQNCDGRSDYDRDSDGYDASTYGGADCADTNAAINPGVAEVWYNGIDGNCDGRDDYDQDGDGHRAQAYGGTDCDDTSATTYVGAPDTWYDGVDANCNGADDYDQDGDGQRALAHGGTDCADTNPLVYLGAPDAWYDGIDADCAGDDDYDSDGDGDPAEEYGGTDCLDFDPTVFGGAPEVLADGIDQDCDGVDEVPTVLPVDDDGDGYDAELDCDDADPATYPGAPETWYDGIDADCAGDDDFDQDGDGHWPAAWGGADCDDANPAVSPAATETWYDGVDQDCDGRDDYDQDGDGALASAHGGTDCDDTDGAVRPGATEVWYDGVDQDCDGRNDHDQDGDSYTATSSGGTDCDDTNPAVRPGAVDAWYDGVDQNCDGRNDYDRDGDGFTSSAYGGTDCNDTDSRIKPGAVERRGDGVDQNCNGNDNT